MSESLLVYGYEVSIATDGEVGIKKALNQEIDAVILDLILPKKNGFEVVKAFGLIQICRL